GLDLSAAARARLLGQLPRRGRHERDRWSLVAAVHRAYAHGSDARLRRTGLHGTRADLRSDHSASGVDQLLRRLPSADSDHGALHPVAEPHVAWRRGRAGDSLGFDTL